MTDDQQLIAKSRGAAAQENAYSYLLNALADALSAAAVREEEIKAREEKRYRAAIGNWREAALKAEGELVAAAVRYRAEGVTQALQIVERYEPRTIAGAAMLAEVRALLDENNETQEGAKPS